MAIAKTNENQSGGGLKRGTIMVQTDGNINVVQGAASIGTISSAYQIPKSAWFRVRALSSAKAETATFVDIVGRATSDGADPSVITIYLWCADVAGITLTANAFIMLEYEFNESVLSD
jgi:hypothetical protein